MKVDEVTEKRPVDAGPDTEQAPHAEEPEHRGRSLLLPGSLWGRLTAFALLSVVAIAAAAIVVIDLVTRLPEGAAFRIDDQVVTEGELQRRVDVLSGLYGIQPPKDAAQRDKFRRDTAKAVAVSNILDAAAGDEGIVIAEKDARDQLAGVIKENFQNNRQAFTAMLGQKGISEQDVLDEIARQLRNTRLFAQVTSSAKKATDEQAEAYYTENKKEMVSPEQRRLANIVVETREEAEAVAGKAAQGEDFGDLVAQYTIDGQTKADGGDLGLVAAADLEAGYAAAAFAAGPGKTFGPVQTQSGWNVGKVTKVQKAVPLSFEQLKDAITGRMNNDAKIALWRSWLGKKITSAEVEYAPEYQPSNPDEPPADITKR